MEQRGREQGAGLVRPCGAVLGPAAGLLRRRAGRWGRDMCMTHAACHSSMRACHIFAVHTQTIILILLLQQSCMWRTCMRGVMPYLACTLPKMIAWKPAAGPLCAARNLKARMCFLSVWSD